MPQGWPEDNCPFQPPSLQWVGQVSSTALCQELLRVILVELLQVGLPRLLRLSLLKDPGAVCGSWCWFGGGFWHGSRYGTAKGGAVLQHWGRSGGRGRPFVLFLCTGPLAWGLHRKPGVVEDGGSARN